MDPFQDIVYFVDAASGQILHSFNNILQFDYAETDGHDSPLIGHVEPTAQTEIALMSSVPNMATASLATITITGRINGNYWPEAHTDPTATSGYPTTTIKLYNQLGQHITSFSTDRTGYYSVTYSMAPGIYIMQIPLQSTYVQIRDGSNSVPYVNKTVSLVSGTNTYNHT